MRIGLIALSFVLLAPASGQAAESALDRYAACLIGKAAVALNHQEGTIDPARATADAYDKCKDLKTEDETGRLDAFVSKAVEAIAAVAKQ